MINGSDLTSTQRGLHDLVRQPAGADTAEQRATAHQLAAAVGGVTSRLGD